MEYKKSLFGRTVIESSDYDDVSDDIELEYYETHNIAGENNRKYGIEVVKREEKSEKFKISEPDRRHFHRGIFPEKPDGKRAGIGKNQGNPERAHFASQIPQ